jgi:electron transfer flavoprotein alpha subunit
MANKILVFLEQRDGKLKKTSFEAVKVGNLFKEKLGAELETVSVGSEVNNLEKAGGYGTEKVVHFKSPDLQNYAPTDYANLVKSFADETGADILIFPHTALGKDLAPRVAGKLDAGIAMDCVEFNFDGDEITASRPVYAGKALIDVKVNSEKKVFTIRPNVFAVSESSGNSAEIEERDAGEIGLNEKTIEVKKSEGKLDVTEAEKIVSGGRGLKGPENFHLVEDLAKELGAAVGASRAVVDAGWRPHSEQVGQTGKTVSPQLYVAVGISGAIQHLAGMRSSKYIVAINKDKEAPIFQVADYGVVGDVFEIVPAMIEELKKVNE